MTPTAEHRSLLDLAYRVLLRLYPAPFRREYGSDMLQLYRDRYRALRGAGGQRLLRFLGAAFRDVIVHGVREHGRRLRDLLPERTRMVPDSRSPGWAQKLGTQMETLWQDTRFALRSLRRSPGVVSAAVVTLALGIGATSTVFSGVDVFMFRPLPMPDADAVYYVYTTNAERDWTSVSLSPPDFRDLRDGVRGLDIAAKRSHGYNLSGGDRPERISGRDVSWNFFRVAGTAPALGRGFNPDDEREGQHRVAILSDGLWRRRFGADPDVLGSAVRLDGEPYTIVGVMPARFWFEHSRTEIWTPLSFGGDEYRHSHMLSGVARLAPAVSAAEAQAELSQVAARLAAAYPETSAGNGARIAPLRWEIFDEGFRQGSAIGSVGVALLLLIACANVASLFLARAAGRGREIAVRGALGASRGRVSRQLLTESFVVALCGGALGLVVAWWGIKGLLTITPPEFPRADAIALDGRVALFTVGASLVTGLLFGLAPALIGSRLDLTGSLKEGGRTGTGRSQRARMTLVVAEVSLALMLLVSSALLVQAFLKLQRSDVGFDPAHLLTFRITLSEQAYPDSQTVVKLEREFVDDLGALPGVVAVSGTSILPMQGNAGTYYSVPSLGVGEDERQPVVSYRYVLPDYFATMGIPVLEGRGIRDSDVFDSPKVAVVNESFVRRHWPDRSPLGDRIVLASGSFEIVGVVRDSRDDGPNDEPYSMMFMPALGRGVRSMSFLLRTRGEPADLSEAIHTTLASFDGGLPLYDTRWMDDLVSVRIDEDAVMAKLMGALALVALILSVVGVYAVMAHSVAQRTREVGIRLALGASTRDVVTMVLRQGSRLALLGIGFGLAASLAITKTLAFFLYGVSPFDITTFTAATAVLFGACLLAAYVPARRATKVDPVVALRTE